MKVSDNQYRKIQSFSCFMLLICMAWTTSLYAQNKQDPINQLFQQGQWDRAIELLTATVQDNPTDGQAWSRLGYALYNKQQYEQAIHAYQKADSLEYFPSQIRYNIACSYALMGDLENSLKYLNRAINAGFRNLQLISTDSDLKTVRNDPRFQELVTSLEQEVHPCLHDPRYQEFDFWIGEWDVFNQQGQKVGENSIQKTMQGCILQEKWHSARGSRGQSINYYDPRSDEWKQTWVDEGGRIIRYSGKVIDGSMHFFGEFIDKDGKRELARVLLEPLEDGNLHHLIEHSRDYGKTWYIWFDGIYVRKK